MSSSHPEKGRLGPAGSETLPLIGSDSMSNSTVTDSVSGGAWFC